MKHHFGMTVTEKFVSSAARIKSKPVIFCGYLLLNEVIGWLREVEKDWEVHSQGTIPGFVWRYVGEHVPGLSLVQPSFELGIIMSLNYLGQCPGSKYAREILIKIKGVRHCKFLEVYLCRSITESKRYCLWSCKLYRWVACIKIMRVIRKSLRDFRPLRYSSRDGHAEGDHVNRGRDTPGFCPTVQVLICSFLLCLSWLLHSRVRKFRTDLWIALWILYNISVYLHENRSSQQVYSYI
jgi:hypothetical protein